MAMMKKRDVYNQVVTDLSLNLESDGFKFIKSKERIIRYHDLGFDVIIFHIVDYNPVFEIDFSLRTRIDEVENIINLFMKDCMNPKFMPLTETTAISYKKLSGSIEDFISVTNEIELELASKKIISLVKDRGISFYEQNKDVQKLNQITKRQILHEHQGLSLFHNRRTLMQSITLMKLCNDPDFDKLKDKYKELYVPFIGEEVTGRKAIDDLIEYLQEYNPKVGAKLE
jgi:hypothetical protein